MKASFVQKIVVLGTGGTIAGLSVGPQERGQYRAGELSIERIWGQVNGVGLEPHFDVDVHQVCQIDSKDMAHAHWHLLLAHLQTAMADPAVRGILITHGTDTLEETAFLLSWLLPHDKPVVLTGAMRAWDAPDSDGRQNLQDAWAVLQRLIARSMGGVRVVMAGEVHPAGSVQKMHAQSLHAFESEAPMPLSRLTQDPPTSPQSLGSGQFEAPRSVEDVWPYVRPSLAQVLAHPQWPRVEVVMSHAGVEPAGVVLALVEQLERERGRGREAAPATPRLAPLRGLVVSGTGSGTWAESLREPLLSLMSLGVTVVLTSRVPWGHEGLSGHPLPGPKTPTLASGLTTSAHSAHSPGGAQWSQLSPVKARIALALHLLASQEATA